MIAPQVFAAEADILVLGDSISASYGLEKPELGWVSLLQQKLKEQGRSVEVFNASIAGITTEEALSRIDAWVAQKKPSILIIELGTNDQLRGISPGKVQANLEAIISKSKASKILILGANALGHYPQFAKVYADLATQPNRLWVPDFLSGIANNPDLMLPGDEVHPNSKAQPILLQTVWEKLSRF